MDYKKLEWDTNFFGFNVYKIYMLNESILEKLKKEKAFIYYEDLKNIDQEILEKYNGELINKRVSFIKKLPLIPINDYKEYANPEYDYNKMFKVFLNSGKYSRFKMDKRFEEKLFIRFYREWYKNTLNYKFCDKYFILPDNKGILSLALFDEYSKIRIISVDNKSIGKGYGSILMNEAEKYSMYMKKKYIKVETQLENKIAINFYKKKNFEVEFIKNVYHFDLREEI